MGLQYEHSEYRHIESNPNEAPGRRQSIVDSTLDVIEQRDEPGGVGPIDTCLERSPCVARPIHRYENELRRSDGVLQPSTRLHRRPFLGHKRAHETEVNPQVIPQNDMLSGRRRMLWRSRDNLVRNRRHENGYADGVFQRNAGQRIRRVKAGLLGRSRQQQIELRRRNALRGRHVLREGRCLLDALEGRIASPPAMVLPEFFSTAKPKTSGRHWTVVAPFVAVMMNAWNDRRVFRDGEKSGTEAHRPPVVQETGTTNAQQCRACHGN
jgi:hypothetical protein